MRAIVRAPAMPQGRVKRSWADRLLAAVERWAGSRIERAAMNQLGAMSDRELKDIGLTRSGITAAVRGRTAHRQPTSPYNRASFDERHSSTMHINTPYPPRPACRGRTIALHCSGAGASQWRPLAEALGTAHEVLAPEHYGCESRGPWSGERAFTLADEAAKAVELIDEHGENVHLVGHSYGGGVALHVALARPKQIASMALYEPSAFHLLRQMGEEGRESYAEIAALAQRIARDVTTGDYRGGIAAFVDYWNGPGAWEAMHPAAQDALRRWAPNGPLEFHALLENPTPASAYRAFRFPVLILRGEHALEPSRVIAEGLAELLPRSRLIVVAGAGHMGPFTHATETSRLIAQHISAASLGDAWAATQSRQPVDA